MLEFYTVIIYITRVLHTFRGEGLEIPNLEIANPRLTINYLFSALQIFLQCHLVGHLLHFVCGHSSCSVTPLMLVIGSHHLKCFSFALFRNYIINLFSERPRSIL